jgi:hypothetical protein
VQSARRQDELIANASVLALVSERIYPQEAAQSAAMPYIVYQRVSSVPQAVATGTNATTETRIQFQIVDDNYDDARTLADLVKGVLHGWSEPTGTPSVSGCDLVMDMDGESIPSGTGEDSATWVVLQDYTAWHN